MPICLLQACSFTNKPFEKVVKNSDYISTVTDLKIGEERIVRVNGKAYESTLIVQRSNSIQCQRDISYKDGIAEYRIPSGTYSTLGLIEVEPNKKLPFFEGAYQVSAIGGSSGMSLYFPINPDGSLYKSYYTDPYGNLYKTKGELKEWGGSGISSDRCIPPTPHEVAKTSVCAVYYDGANRVNGLLAPTVTLDNGKERRKLIIMANAELNFCGVGIDIYEASDILHFAVREIAESQ